MLCTVGGWHSRFLVGLRLARLMLMRCALRISTDPPCCCSSSSVSRGVAESGAMPCHGQRLTSEATRQPEDHEDIEVHRPSA